MKSTVANLLLALVSFAVAILLAEGLLRLSGYPASSPTHQELFVQHDSLLGWSKIPNAEGWRVSQEFRVFEKINAKGLRGPDHPYRKPAGRRRVLLLGDSFTEGQTQNLDALVSEALWQRLNVNGEDCYEVINGGTGGYSTDQELLFFQSEGVRYEPDVTILMFVANDIWYNTQSKYWRGYKPRFELTDSGLVLTNVPVPPPDSADAGDASGHEAGSSGRLARIKGWLGDRSATYDVLRRAVKQTHFLHVAAIHIGLAEPARDGTRRMASAPDEFRIWESEYSPEIRGAWRLTEALLVRLRAATATAGSELIVFKVPNRSSVYPDVWDATRRKYGLSDENWIPTRDEAELAAICERHAMDCILPAGRFREEARTLSSVGGELYYPEDGHWNSHGHRLAGRLLYEHLRTRYGWNQCPKDAAVVARVGYAGEQ